MTVHIELEKYFLNKFKNFSLSPPTSQGGVCEFMKGPVKSQTMCGRKAEFQFEGKWYCGKVKPSGEYSMHMGTVTKTLTKKKKITKADAKKFADENTKDLIDRITQRSHLVARRAWEGGPYVYTSDDPSLPVLVVNHETQIVTGMLVNKEAVSLNSEAIKMCRAMNLQYEYEEDEDEVNDESLSEADDSDQEDEEDELETSEDDEEENEDDEDNEDSGEE